MVYSNDEGPQPRISFADKTFLALIFNAEGTGFDAWYGNAGCQTLRRNALYTWMKEAIEQNKAEDIDFLEIMVSVVLQLQKDFPHLIPTK
jgi:hypothetical protein